ncbi:hypothetical protein AX15_003632 [Amanita polypyramis BW_CC]|nr:hypothetical protein AX15_003632 [Amanita polypyramis BW_CC]
MILFLLRFSNMFVLLLHYKSMTSPNAELDDLRHGETDNKTAVVIHMYDDLDNNPSFRLQNGLQTTDISIHVTAHDAHPRLLCQFPPLYMSTILVSVAEMLRSWRCPCSTNR